MSSKILETKFYEVSLEKEQAYISKLRHKLFPNANTKVYWEVGSEIFSWLPPGKMELPFQDVMFNTKHGKIDVKKFVHAFGKGPFNFRGNDFNPTQVGLNIEYKFLFDGSLEPFRLAHQYFDQLQEMHAKGIKQNTVSSYKLSDFAETLNVELNDELEKKVKMLCEIGILNCANCQGDIKNGVLYIGIRSAESFSDWYSQTISTFKNILEQNNREFWLRIPFINWYMKPEYESGSNFSDAFGGSQVANGVSKSLQVLVFIFFVILLCLAIFCGQSLNWTACSIFSAAAVSLLVVMINKMI